MSLDPNPNLFLIVATFAVTVILVASYIVSVRSRTSPKQKNKQKIKPVGIDWKAIQHPDIQSEIEANRKINAIKLYREMTGQGLKEAKEAIEYAMEQGIPKKGKQSDLPSGMSDAGIRDLIAEGKIEEAIEIYRQFAGVDKFSAEEAIKDIQRDMRLGDNTDLDSAIDSQPDPFQKKRTKR